MSLKRILPSLLVRLLFPLAGLAACGGEAPTAIDSPEAHRAPPQASTPPAPSTPPARAPAHAPERAIAWTSAGDLAVIETHTGAVIASSAGGHLGGARDLAIDASGSRAVVFEGNEDATWGDIASYPLRGRGTIGARKHHAYVDGDARILPVPGGITVFSDGAGPRWKVFRDDGTETLGLSMPRPASVAIGEQGAGFRLNALAYGDGVAGPALEIDAVYENAGTLGVLSTDALALTPSDPPCARLVETPGLGGDVLVDVAPGGLALTRIDSGDAGNTIMIALDEPVHRLEAVVLAGYNRIAVLASSPSRVIVISLDAAAGLGVSAYAEVGLPGTVRVEDRFFSRDLALVGERLFAATDAGVFALDMTATRKSLSLALDASFEGSALRGPLVALAD